VESGLNWVRRGYNFSLGLAMTFDLFNNTCPEHRVVIVCNMTGGGGGAVNSVLERERKER
jgi:hypothetical protein